MIVLIAAGTRGDVQPALALAQALQNAGRGVLLLTHPEYQALATRRAVPNAPLLGNPSDLMTHSGGQSALTYDGSWLRSARASLAFLKAARPVYARMLDSAWNVVRGQNVEAVLFGLPALWGLYLAEALQVPGIGAFLQPVTRTAVFPSALLPSLFSAGRFYNRLTHRLVELATWLPWRQLVNQWRVDSLGLKPAAWDGPLAALQGNTTQLLYGFSPVVTPRPPNWPANHILTGYWFLGENQPYLPPAALQDFLQSGQPPVYIGLGSPGARDLHRILEAFLSALQATGIRAVLDVDPGSLDGLSGVSNILAIHGVPHTWLLPRLAGIIHHGGAGTTAAGLRAGLPGLVIPMTVDQFFWAESVTRLGAGPGFIPQRLLTTERLIPALERLVGDGNLRDNAARVASLLALEDGTAHAVEHILSILQGV